MDGLFAKRVLIALARLLSFDSVRRCNYGNRYYLKLIDKKNKCNNKSLAVVYDKHKWPLKLTFTSTKWENILKTLEGTKIPYSEQYDSYGNYGWKKITTIEELIVDLELQGYLKHT